VGELRNWIQAYHSWKNWQEGSLLMKNTKEEDEKPPASPLNAIISFSQSHKINVADIENLLKLRTLRAKSRLEGFKYLYQLLINCSFGTVRHQLLSPIGRVFNRGRIGHYLDGVIGCGSDLSQKIEQEFSQLFRELIKILGDSTHDTTSRLICLGICGGISFKDTDVQLLINNNIFEILRKIISDNSNIKGEGEEAKRRIILHSASWIAFRLLTMRVSCWNHDDTKRERILYLQSQVFDLMCAELHIINEFE